MSRTQTSILLGAVVLSLALLSGCGKGGGGAAAPSGTYRSTFGPDQSFSLNFLGGSAVEATLREGGRDKSYKTSFVTSGDSIILAVPEGERESGGPDSLTLKRNGDALELTMQGMTMRFEKL